MTLTRVFAALGALATAILVSACSGNSTESSASDGHGDHGDHSAPQTSTVTGAPAGFDAEDVGFVSGMIPHHQQAVELSALVGDRTTNAELIALAKQIAGAQQPEIDTMKAFLVQWQENPQDESGAGGHAGHQNMAGMADDATMAKLKTLNGAAFDTLWLQSMIAHHQGAVEMAKAELADGQNVDAKQLAQQIITAQQAEIDQMQKMLGGAS